MENKENIKPQLTQIIEEVPLLKFEVDKNVFLRVIQADDLYIDIRKFYKGFPTKQGARFKMSIYNQIKDQLDKF